MRNLKVDNKEYSIPSEWNELSFLDLMEVCRIMLMNLDQNYKRLILLGYFTDTTYKAMRRWPADAMPEILAIFDYLFKESHLTKNPFPEIGKLKGPDPGLTNFTFEQYFGESEPYYQLTLSNGNGHDLDNLINIMYNRNGNESDRKTLAALSEIEKLAIFYYYQGCTAFIKLKFRDVFQKSSSNNKIDGLEFTRFVNSLNGGDLSKNKAIKETNLYEALIYLQNIIQSNGS